MFLSTDMFLTLLTLLIKNPNDYCKKTVSQFIDLCSADIDNLPNTERDVINFFKNLILDLLGKTGSILTSEEQLSAFRVKVSTSSIATANKDIQKAIDIICTSDPLDDETYFNLLNEVSQAISWYNGNKQMKKVYGNLTRYANTISKEGRQELIQKIRQDVTELSSIFNDVSFNANQALDKIDFSDKRSILSGLEEFNKRRVETVFTFGLQGFNRLFGPRGGLCLGESMVINSLSSQGKSTLLMCIARWIVEYNSLPPTKGIPTVLFISLENENSDNLMEIFRSTYRSVTKEDPDKLSIEEIVEFVYDVFNRNGWRFILERRLGIDFGVDELISCFNEYKKDGYSIVACIIDYMNLMKKNESQTNGNHLQLKEIYNRVRNFLTHENCCMITAHQLNREAEKLKASGVTNLVDKFGAAHLAEGMDPQREIDIAIYLHSEMNHLGTSYSTMRIDKHRNGWKSIPNSHKRVNYRHGPYGFVDDIGGADTSVRDIYADGVNDDDILSSAKGFDSEDKVIVAEEEEFIPSIDVVLEPETKLVDDSPIIDGMKKKLTDDDLDTEYTKAYGEEETNE